jgi:hypothetical protein
VEGLKELNSPLAIISILAILFGFVMMGLRELLWFLKGVKKSTPSDKMQEAFAELTLYLKLLNKQIEENHKLQNRDHEEILKGIDRVERKI